MCFPLLSRLKLADEERAATEGSLGCLNSCPLCVFDTLVAYEAEAKHAFTRVVTSFLRFPGEHQLEIADFAKCREEVDKLFLRVSGRYSWVDWEATEVKVLSSHLLLELESSHAYIRLTKLLLQGGNHVEFRQVCH